MASDWFFKIPAGVGVLIGVATKTKQRSMASMVAIVALTVFGLYQFFKKKPKIKVYHTQTLRAARIAWIVEELGAGNDFHFVSYNPLTVTENRLEWYDSHVNSHSTVPVAIYNNEQVLMETVSMCLYLVQLNQKLLPDKSELPFFYDLIVYAVATLDPMLSVLEKNTEPGAERDEKALSAAVNKAEEFAEFFNQYLDDRSSEYIFGSRFTAADVVVGYCLLSLSKSEDVKNFSDHHRIREYLTRLQARKAFQKSMT